MYLAANLPRAFVVGRILRLSIIRAFGELISVWEARGAQPTTTEQVCWA